MPAELPAVLRSAKSYSRLLRKAGGEMLDITSLRPDAGLQVALYESPPYNLRVPPMDVARLSINLRSAPVTGGFADDRARSYSGRRYSMFLAPAHVDAHWCKQQASRHINIYFSSAALDVGEDSRHGLRFGEQPLLDVSCAGFKPWIDALEQCMTCGDPVADDASVGLARLILSGVAHRNETPPLRLSPKAVRVITEYAQSNLEGAIRVADLAAAVGLTPNRFTLAFTATTGRPPHRFVLECRLARAQDLLLHTPLPLADVAAACGFASQQHLTTAMRHLNGTTPGQVRRSANPAGR